VPTRDLCHAWRIRIESLLWFGLVWFATHDAIDEKSSFPIPKVRANEWMNVLIVSCFLLFKIVLRFCPILRPIWSYLTAIPSSDGRQRNDKTRQSEDTPIRLVRKEKKSREERREGWRNAVRPDEAILRLRFPWLWLWLWLCCGSHSSLLGVCTVRYILPWLCAKLIYSVCVIKNARRSE